VYGLTMTLLLLHRLHRVKSDGKINMNNEHIISERKKAWGLPYKLLKACHTVQTQARCLLNTFKTLLLHQLAKCNTLVYIKLWHSYKVMAFILST